MKLFKTKHGIAVQNESKFYLLENEEWDSLINDDALFEKITASSLKELLH